MTAPGIQLPGLELTESRDPGSRCKPLTCTEQDQEVVREQQGGGSWVGGESMGWAR